MKRTPLIRKPKEKKCKAKGCNNKFTPRHSFEAWCSPECGFKIANTKLMAKKAKEEKEERKAVRLQKNALKDWSKELQDEVNHIARLIDFMQPCLAKQYHPEQMHGGHIYSRGSNKTISLNLHNIHRQSAQSNHFQNDDGLMREGIVREYGSDYMNFISELRRTPPIKKSNKEYQETTTLARKIVRQLENKGLIYSKKDRIKMRNEINILLGIYDLEYCVYQTEKLKTSNQ